VAHGDVVVCGVGGARLGQCVHKREIRWRGFYPHHLSRVNKKTKPLQSGGASFGAVVHFCAQKMRVRQKHELWPNLQICPPEQLAREPPVGRGGHSPDFSRLVSPKGAHCESSELGLGTEICLNWLARRDNMGVSTQADCETLNGVLTFPFTRELNTRFCHLPTCTLDSRQASKRTFANTRQTSKTADTTGGLPAPTTCLRGLFCQGLLLLSCALLSPAHHVSLGARERRRAP